MILLIAILLVAFVVGWPWGVVVLAVGCILEAGEVVFLRRWSKRIGRRTKATTGPEAMIGQQAEVVQECRPAGTVRINGELWEARCDAGAGAGQTVDVKRVDGLTLVVAPR